MMKEHYFAVLRWDHAIAGGPSPYIPEHELYQGLSQIANGIRSGELENVMGVYKMAISGPLGSQSVSIVDAAKETAEYINSHWEEDEVSESGKEFCEELGFGYPPPAPTFWDRVDRAYQEYKDSRI
jgi:hypothetical protein